MKTIRIQQVDYQQQQNAINTIRIIVFQEEQGVAPALEFDGQDEAAIHLLAYIQDQPVATLRIRQLDRQRVKIERLAVLQEARGQGIGTKLMITALDIIKNNSQTEQVIINAQAYIKKLYEKLGFEQVGEGFEEAGIPHIKMIKLIEN